MGYSHLFERLAQGSRPDLPGIVLPFDTVVLCAYEIQPPTLPVSEILRAPLDDARPSADEIKIALIAAGKVARRLRAGKRVLVTCAAGLNRSGLVNGLALLELGLTADEAVTVIRHARGSFALSNSHFVEVLRLRSHALHGKSRRAA